MRHKLNTPVQGISPSQTLVERVSEAVIQFGTLAAGDRAEKHVMLSNGIIASAEVHAPHSTVAGGKSGTGHTTAYQGN